VSSPGRSTAIDAVLAAVESPVHLLFFEQSVGCDACPPARRLLEELARLSSHITVDVLTLSQEPERAAHHEIDRVPAIVVSSQGRDRIRFFGAPDGHERMSLAEAIRMTASGHSGLSPESRAVLAGLNVRVRLQVFFTPGCAYCPQMVTLANQLAVESPLVSASAIDATNYPDLVRRYGVTGVPKTIINDTIEIMGAVDEAALVNTVLSVAAMR
jgi:glutaredoxin-like protein